ncbi:MAG: catalase/peroxidase HPI [Promicromonosporaceae bacterium]|nr:catalase/peroxidase HPI [Promicromonosporaceae bacterium]
MSENAETCPVVHGATHPTQGGSNSGWWPNQLNLKMLARNPVVGNPMGSGFDYAAAFEALDLDAVKADIVEVMHDSQPWWPADFGSYAPFFVRMAWHSAGTYRSWDGRGGGGEGQQRFAPLNSWPDNVSLDKARRLLWPVKKKYGQALSWADLMILAGNVAMADMGFPILGFGGGRADVYEADQDVYWGPETTWLADQRYTGERDLEKPLAAVQMGLIYVNPEGPNGNPDPLASAVDVKETFRRMGMDLEETVALIAGGHTFGKTHGAAPDSHLEAEPEGADLEMQGLGWKNNFGTGVGDDSITSGLEVTWTYHPLRWDNEYFHILFGYEWELMESPAGAKQWRPVDGGGSDMVPLAHSAGRREPRMLTSDLALRFDPEMGPISARFKDDQQAFTDAFARAWFKLTHRDMGPKARYKGAEVPAEDFVWQDPLPARTLADLTAEQVEAVKAAVRESGRTVAQLVTTAWAAASSYRDSDKRGGANGGRIRLEPQRSWDVNNPTQLAQVLPVLERIASDAGASFADVVVLAGGVGVELAAAAAGVQVEVPFTQGRVDATQEQTDLDQFAWLEPVADGFRNYAGKSPLPAEYSLIDRASLLGLSAPEMTVLVAGLRVLGANHDATPYGVFTDTPGVLDNAWFVNVLDMGTAWTALDPGKHAYQGSDRVSGEKKWVGTRSDLVFGSNSELRALAEVYAADDAKEKFVKDFVAAWVKVMDADRFDLR